MTGQRYRFLSDDLIKFALALGSKIDDGAEMVGLRITDSEVGNCGLRVLEYSARHTSYTDMLAAKMCSVSDDSRRQ
jgi:hypothetical protein